MRWIYVFQIMFPAIVNGVIASVWVHLKNYPNIDQYLSGDKLRTVHPCGYQQCKKQCERRTDCSHINFIRHNFTCLLMSSDSPPAAEIKKGILFYSKNNAGGICSEIGCTTSSSTCIRTNPGSQACLKDLPKCQGSGYTILEGTSICIKHDNTPRKWQEAKDHCEANGGRLPYVNSENLLHKLRQYASSNSIGYFWLWARRDSAQSAWKWVNGLLVETGELWCDITDEGSTSLCMELYQQEFRPYTCDSTSTHTVCEQI